MECLSQVVVRGKEGKYLLVETTSRKLQLTTCRLREEEDFQAAALRCLNEELCINGEVLGILRIQHKTGKWVASGQKLVVIFLTNEQSGRPNLGASTLTLKRLTIEELKSQSSYVLDPSILKLLQEADSGGAVYPTSLLECVDSSGWRRAWGRRRESEPAEKPELQRGVSLEEQMLEQTGYGAYEVEQITEEFQLRSGSLSSRMSQEVFSALLSQLGLPKEHCGQCYSVLCSSPSEGLTLQELQLGLCALDPVTPHGGLAAQFRCQFIFQFYNASNTGVLTFPELKQMVQDICSVKKISLTEEDLETAAKDHWKTFDVSKEQGIPLTKFLGVVGQLKFRGTSVLFRLPRSPVKRQQEGTKPQSISSPVQNAKCNEDGKAGGGSKRARTTSLEAIADEEEPMDTLSSATRGTKVPPSSGAPVIMIGDEVAEAEESQDYTIATHFVKVRRSGALADVTTLWDLVGTEAVAGSVEAILEHNKPSFDRLPSINAFDKQSKSNEMLSGLRYFEHALRDNGRGQPKPAFSWGAVDLASVARCFLQLCMKATDIFYSEPRLLEIASPSYVLGDLHGNFRDLVCFEKVLWRMGSVLTPASFLFLGDYVDRGDYGFEVVAYLFAQKLLMPSKFLLIRGNHEIRAVQETFTYKSECIHKFGESLGLEVWEATNKAFDAMPLAAVIDKKVFCVHGGIPFPSLGEGLISSLNEIPSHLPDPMEQSPLAWEIMWNDPIRQDEIDPTIEQQLKENQGFVDNFARGTAHMFSSEALDLFLKRNKLSHVIRAHECKAAGFQLQQRGRLLTVFSSSHYCGATNEAACVLVDNKKIRTIRLDTT